MAVCPSGRRCMWWAERYLKDCICGVRDYVSLGFGLVSVFSWAVAEIPQIITNFKSGSTEGVSLAFLMTWIVGDLFNLVGCWLEPTTLPTQLYTAVVYTITTLILGSQAAYYDYISKWWNGWESFYNYICNWWKGLKSKSLPMNEESVPVNVSESIAISTELARDTDLERFSPGNLASSLPIPSRKNLYYMSARSLASSHTPTLGSYLASPPRGSGRSAPNFTSNLESIEDEGSQIDLVSKSPKNSKATLRSVAGALFFVGGLNFIRLLHVHNTITTFDSTKVERASVVLTGRRILQAVSAITARDLMIQEQSTSLLGTYLGWLMAAIYMGGRLPQIYLNLRRGTVEGLNPWMFIFAIIGNATYVASIVIRTLEWSKLKPNMPWLVDAAACVLLDCVILIQFVYYKMRRPDDHEGDINGDYVAINGHETEN